MRAQLFTVTALAAAILGGIASTPAAAASAGQLPGQGRVVSGQVTVGNAAAGTMNLNISGHAVINWGGGGTGAINAGGVAGFNVGSGAHLNFNGSNAAAVLNIDSSGHPSHIDGTLSARGADVFIANGNGIIVGARARIASDHMVGLIGNRLGADAASAFDGRAGSIRYSGSGGDVTVLRGASFSGGGKVLIAGGGNVNVDLSAFAGPVALRAGRANGAGGVDNTAANLSVSGTQHARITQFSSAGNATNHGTLWLSKAAVGGAFTNHGTLNLADGVSIAGRLINQRTLRTGGHVTVGGLSNQGTISASGLLSVNGTLDNAGTVRTPDASGQLSVVGTLTNNGTIEALSYIGVTRGDLNNRGSITLIDQNDAAGSVGAIRVLGGNLRNSGRIASAVDRAGAARYQDLSLQVVNGDIDNAQGATLANFGELATGSDSHAAGFVRHADYSIRNAGTIAGNTSIDANLYGREQANSSTGSFVNSGVLDVRSAETGGERMLSIVAHDNLDLGGKVRAEGHALDASHSLDGITLQADQGALTVATALVFHADGINSGAAYLSGRSVRIASNLIGLGKDAGIYVTAGRATNASYAFRVDPDVTFSASHVYVSGQ